MAIKEAIEYYKSLKREERLKKRFVRNPLDYEYLQMMIDKVEMQDINIEIRLNDGTLLIIKPNKINKRNNIFEGE